LPFHWWKTLVRDPDREVGAGDRENQVSIERSDEVREKLERRINDLCIRLLELNDRIAEDDDNSKRSLREAIADFNAITRALGFEEEAILSIELDEEGSTDASTP
jgi:hypothetical protein